MQFVLGVACLVATSCLAAVVPETREVKLARATNEFAFDLLKSYKNEKNVFLSPFSISTALAMVYLGADGHSYEAMRKALKYEKYGLSEEDVHGTYWSVLNNIKRSSENYQLSIFNSALVQKDFTILHIYGHAIRQFYNAHIESVDFKKQGEQIKINVNSKVEQATNGKIKDLLEKTPRTDTKLLLLNAVHFLGNWEKPFNPVGTRERIFFNNGVTEKKVKMMSNEKWYQYSNDNDLDATIVVLPYKGEATASMVIVLPNEKSGVDKLLQKITPGSLESALRKARFGPIDLSIPKFNLKYSTQLREPLARLGLAEIFNDSANLDRIAGEASNLKVSSVVHKAAIDVDEKGSEASAATAVEIILKSFPPSITVNHPFLFFIVDDRSRMILFSGRVDEL